MRLSSASIWRYLLLAAAGAVTALAHPPVDADFLVVVGLVVALFALRSLPTRAAAAFGMAVFAAAMFGVLLAWVSRFGVVALVALVAVQSLFLAPVGWAVASSLRGWRWVAVVTATWVGMETLRARWPLGGFEWGQLGYAWHDTPLRALAPAVGVLGLTALTVATAAVVVIAIAQRRARWRWLALPAGVALLAAAAPTTTAPAGDLDVAVVQIGPVCTEPVVRCPDEDENVLAAFAETTRAASVRPDLVVWGEGALGGVSLEAAGKAAVAAAGVHSELLAGATAPAAEGRFINSNVLYSADGAVLAKYRKRHPVPFGEFVPLRSLLGAFADVGALVPADMVRGSVPGRLPVHNAIVGTVSSFEASFAREVRVTAADAGVHAVVVLTSEASYGRSAVSDQLLAMAQLRAAELGKSVLVAATTGRSALFAPGGERLAVTPLLAPAVMEVSVPLRSGTTVYGAAGDVPVIVGLAGLALAALFSTKRTLVGRAAIPTATVVGR